MHDEQQLDRYSMDHQSNLTKSLMQIFAKKRFQWSKVVRQWEWIWPRAKQFLSLSLGFWLRMRTNWRTKKSFEIRLSISPLLRSVHFRSNLVYRQSISFSFPSNSFFHSFVRVSVCLFVAIQWISITRPALNCRVKNIWRSSINSMTRKFLDKVN